MITIFDWLEFKEIADELSNNLKEANARAAIILYYYSIFSVVRDYLIYLKHQYQFKNNYKIHERVWKFLLSTEDDNENEIGEFLREVRGIRNHVNYDNKYDFDYFLEELINIQSKINNIVSSILYLRDNPYREF